MKIVFLSNYFNHHQKPLSDALYARCEWFWFIATGKMRKERELLGYEKITEPYVLQWESGAQKTILKWIDEADVVIAGSAPEHLLRRRKRNRKLIFRYSERPVKGEREPLKYLPRLLSWNLRNPRPVPIYLLSASAYAPYEYRKFFLFQKRAYQWGYFTEVISYPQGYAALEKQKEPNSILWAGRMIGMKHPEAALQAAEKLKEEGFRFKLKMIGAGPLMKDLEETVREKGLADVVSLPGALSPGQVRGVMEKSEIFLFTSDKNEGWGAVLNEAMSSGCAVVASHEIGAVPYLVKHGENGMIYRDADRADLYLKVKQLLVDQQLRRACAGHAYETMAQTWNAEVAAERLLQLTRRILQGEKHPVLYESGPCSAAGVLKDDWFVKENGTFPTETGRRTGNLENEKNQ